MSCPSHCIKQARGFDNRFLSILFEENCGYGKDSKNLNLSYENLVCHYTNPFSRSSKDLATKFYDLKYEWEKNTSHYSSITQIAIHPAYQKIIGMGKDVLPLIMQELALQPDHWFWALKSITGEDPVPPRLRGRIKEMAKVWLFWWSKNKQRYE